MKTLASGTRCIIQILLTTLLVLGFCLPLAADDDVLFFVSDNAVYRADNPNPIISKPAAIPVGYSVNALAVNQVTRKLYVAFQTSVTEHKVSEYDFQGNLERTFTGEVDHPITSISVNSATNRLFAVSSSGSVGTLYSINLSDAAPSLQLYSEDFQDLIEFDSVTVQPGDGDNFFLNRDSFGFKSITDRDSDFVERPDSIDEGFVSLAYFPTGSRVVALRGTTNTGYQIFKSGIYPDGGESKVAVSPKVDQLAKLPNLAVKNSDSTVYAVEVFNNNSPKILVYDINAVDSKVNEIAFSELSTPITAMALHDGGGAQAPTNSECDTVDRDGDGVSACDGDKCPSNGNRINESHCRAKDIPELASDSISRCDADIVFDVPIAISCKSSPACSDREEVGACGSCDLPYVPEGGDTSNCISCPEGQQAVAGECVEDQCPNSDKTEPTGECGCSPDIDSDGDGALDCVDQCPYRALLQLRNETCGCDIPGTDKFGNTTCGDKATIPVDQDNLAEKIITNPNTGDQLVPEPPAVNFKERCSKKKGCKAKLIFASYDLSVQNGVLSARKGKSKRKNKLSYQATLTNLSSKKGKTQKRLAKRNKLSLKKLKPGSNYSLNYKVVLKGGSGKTKASSASSTTITFRTPGS